MQKTDRDPTTCLDSLAGEARDTMQELDRMISGIMAGHSRVLWQGTFWSGSEQTIIGYGDLTMKQSCRRTVEWFMVGLDRQKTYQSDYVNAVEDRQYVAEKYAADLGKVKVGKSSKSFRSIDDVNLETLARIVGIACNQLDSAA